MMQMNNHVIFAAAGYGKTYSLCSKAKEAINNGNKHILLISYTNEGVKSLENEYRKQNDGVLDNGVIIKTWYSFLLSEFIKPYQCSLSLYYKYYKENIPFNTPENFIKSIAFYNNDPPLKFFNQTHIQYFVNSNRDIIPDRVSNLAYLVNDHSSGKALVRIEEIYSHIFIDELQDYAGWDLEIIRLLFESKVEMTCVGDYMQATYRTNNSPKNKQYRDDKIQDFFKLLEKKKMCTISYANTTRRFNSEICSFVNSIYGKTGFCISPSFQDEQRSDIDNTGVYIMGFEQLKEYCEYYNPTILRYDKRTKIGFIHNCDMFNYGGSKGATYERVVIIPVSTTLPFIEKQIKISSNQTRAKFYVACTRAKHSIVFAINKPKVNALFKSVEINISGITLPALKYIHQ